MSLPKIDLLDLSTNSVQLHGHDILQHKLTRWTHRVWCLQFVQGLKKGEQAYKVIHINPGGIVQYQLIPGYPCHARFHH